MQQNTDLESQTKYIREDDPALEEVSEYTNYLIDAYKQTDIMLYRDALMDEFEGYMRKYVHILHRGAGSVDIFNKDTKNFLRLFMSGADRESDYTYSDSAGYYINMIRGAMSMYSDEDLYHEVMVVFLSLAEKYKPITYKRNEKTHRISFAHYVQVGMRFDIATMVKKLCRDVLSGRNCIEYKDYMQECDFDFGARLTRDDTPISLTEWVWGDSSSHPFCLLTEMERYLLWLRYESSPDGTVISTREMGDITGFHERTIIYRIETIRKKIREVIDDLS